MRFASKDMIMTNGLKRHELGRRLLERRTKVDEKSSDYLPGCSGEEAQIQFTGSTTLNHQP